jgi:hypothetical protein
MDSGSAGARRQAQSIDVVPAAEFFVILRQVVGFREQAAILDPLQHAVDQIRNNPAFAQSRLLQRILVALVKGGDFRRAEATALDSSTHALVLALLDLRQTGTRSGEDWSNAIEAAEAASA